MKTALNYLGQLRVYSLLDLTILLVASGANVTEFFGAILLHIAFLSYLETRHHHEYRKGVPKYFWLIPTIVGVIIYGHVWYALLYVICSYVYTLKDKSYFAAASPFMRGLQCFFIVAGISGFTSFTWLVLGVLFARNLLGDVRDAAKDAAKGMKTLPVILGLRQNVKYMHLAATLGSTLIWWSYTIIAWYVILLVLLVQISVYELTPR